VFLDYFNVFILKIILKNIYYFNIFMHKKHFKKEYKHKINSIGGPSRDPPLNFPPLHSRQM
jgi:hypothetical protein